MFKNMGVIKIRRDFISEENFDLAIDAGSQDCVSKEDYHEILCPKDDFYNVKSNLEKRLSDISYSSIEWRPQNYKDLSPSQIKIEELIDELNDNDDVQKNFADYKRKNNR